MTSEDKNSLRDDGAEPGPLYNDIGLRTAADTLDFGADMFAFSVAIGPYHQHVGASCFALEVLFNVLAVFGNESFDGGVEKRNGIARMPLSVGIGKVMSGQVAGYGGDGELGTSLWIVKVVVSDVLVRRCALQMVRRATRGDKTRKRTEVNWPPERIWVMDFAMEGFSATQRTRI
jgi:hypothetical protein